MKNLFKLNALNCKLLFTLLFIFSFNFMFAQDEKKPTENPYIGNRYYFDFGKPADENLYHIQQISKKKYLLNGYAKADRKRMNEILKHSENPLVVKQYKSANTLRNVTIVTQIASYPSTILGSIATITTLHDLVQEAKNGKLTFNYYLNTGVSFLSALALPITKAILNKLTNKLYFKAIKTYTSGSSGARL